MGLLRVQFGCDWEKMISICDIYICNICVCEIREIGDEHKCTKTLVSGDMLLFLYVTYANEFYQKNCAKLRCWCDLISRIFGTMCVQFECDLAKMIHLCDIYICDICVCNIWEIGDDHVWERFWCFHEQGKCLKFEIAWKGLV